MPTPSEEIGAVIERLRDKAATVFGPEVWAVLRPEVNALVAIQEQVEGLETQAVINPSPADGATANVQ